MKEIKDIPKQNPFRVPGDYFENLIERVMAKTSIIEPQEEKKVVVRRIRPFIAVAASIAFIAAIGLGIIYLTGNGHKRQSAELTAAADFNNVDLSDIDVATLEEKVAENESLQEVPDISRNEIIDYLIFEDINILDIYEQL